MAEEATRLSVLPRLLISSDRFYLSAITRRLRLWTKLSFIYAGLINLILAFHYPFEQCLPPRSSHSNCLAGTLIDSSNPLLYVMFLASIIFLYSQWDEESVSVHPILYSLQIHPSQKFRCDYGHGRVSPCVDSGHDRPARHPTGSSHPRDISGIFLPLSFTDHFQLTNKAIHVVAYISNKGLEDKSWMERAVGSGEVAIYPDITDRLGYVLPPGLPGAVYLGPLLQQSPLLHPGESLSSSPPYYPPVV